MLEEGVIRMTKRIAVIGGGTMGIGIAQLFSTNGYQVTLVDVNKEALYLAKERMEYQLSTLLSNSDDVKSVLASVSMTVEMSEVKTAEFIIEAVPEKRDLKQQVLQEIERFCAEETIIATNTSGLSIDSLAESLTYPQRMMGTHFFMPAHVIPLVEVVKAKATSEAVADKVMSLLKEVGKRPVLIKKDIPGFIANRIQHAMAREAISLLASGVASAEDIDTVIRYSLAPRLLFSGPLEQRDLNGLDVHFHIASYLYPDLENRTDPDPFFVKKVEAGELGIKSGKGFYNWQDRNVQAIVEEKNNAILQIMKALKDRDNKEGN